MSVFKQFSEFRHLHIFRPRRQQGVALILVLCFVVLASTLLVAYFSRSSAEKLVSNASANGTKAAAIASTALDIVVQDLKQEITLGSDVTGNVYTPKAPANRIPAHSGNPGGAAGSQQSIPNLIRRSVRQDSSTVPSHASAVNAADESFNKRKINLAIWNAHFLIPLASPETAGSSEPISNYVAPDWVILTRSGPAEFPDWEPKLAVAAQDNLQYAVGRYAYAIYDEGGLLDLNAAGCPTNTANAATGSPGPKGVLSYADLTQIPVTPGAANTAGNMTQAQIDKLVGWRNYASAQPTGSLPNSVFDRSAADRYNSWVTSSSNGFLSVSGSSFNGRTDQALISRRQLIQLMRAIATSGTEQIQLQHALQYLGTFSRELNGPTWEPTLNYSSPYDYVTQKNSASAINPSILNPKVKASFTRNNGTSAVVGEPLVKYRFPLEKLALLEKLQAASSLNSQDIDDIARYFGLDVAADSNGLYRHWNYPTTNTKYIHNVPANAGIMTLNQVATQNREPDFFELLQAGILAGSLGKHDVRGDAYPNNLNYGYGSSFVDPDGKVTYQVLRIGANIIDQWDADSYPTTITYTATGDSVYGIEDLPYLNEMFLKCYSSTGLAPINSYLYFELWNPHQSGVINSSLYPTDFRISPFVQSSQPVGATDRISDCYSTGIYITTGGTTTYSWTWQADSSTAWVTSGSGQQHFSNLTGGGVISFSVSHPDTAYREPSLITNGTPTPVGWVPSTSTAALTLNQIPHFPSKFVVDDIKHAAYTGPWPPTSPDANNNEVKWSVKYGLTATFRIQFKDQSGAFHTYGTFVGLDNPAEPAPGTGMRSGPVMYCNDNTSVNTVSYVKCDPRTFRFGSAMIAAAGPGPGTSLASDSSTVNSSPNADLPFGNTANYSAPYRMDLWAVNDSSVSVPSPTSGASPYYTDPDGVQRVGDARYSYPNSPLYSSTAVGVATRPVILNRPFLSVGELGYAYRDEPWKSLDLSTPNSADGALLELFSLKGNLPVLAGRINPNTVQPDVLAALISNAATVQGSASNHTVVSSATSLTIAKAMISLSSVTPFANRADFVTRMMADPSVAAVSTVKNEREAVVRSLAESMNTRTWNLLIDVVAQAGKYPRSAKSLADFVVEGERHYWLHIAIDRYTNEIVDEQLEIVTE